MNKEKKEVIEEAKKFWKEYEIDNEGNFITEPQKYAGYHKRMLKQLRKDKVL